MIEDMKALGLLVSDKDFLNLSLVFPTKRDSNQSPQLNRLARKLNFWL